MCKKYVDLRKARQGTGSAAVHFKTVDIWLHYPKCMERYNEMLDEEEKATKCDGCNTLVDKKELIAILVNDKKRLFCKKCRQKSVKKVRKVAKEGGEK